MNTPPPGALTTPVRVLVIEDDPRANELVRIYLQRIGFETDGCTTGAEAVRLLQRNRYDAFVIDYRLPDMTGKELIERLSKKEIKLPFVAMSAYGTEKESVEMMKLGARNFLLKDWTFTEILPQVIQHIKDEVEKERELGRVRESLRLILRRTIEAMAQTLEFKDPYTTGHQRRVAELSCAIAREMRMAEEAVEGIWFAAFMHDLGKISIPSEILSKPVRLSEAEFEMIKTHPKAGFDILRPIGFPWPIADVALQHHERLDGSGYPAGLRGDRIVPEARIIAVADVVEATTSHRPYRAALGTQYALNEIAGGRGAKYDPDVVDACARLLIEKGFAFAASDGPYKVSVPPSSLFPRRSG